MNAPTNSQAGRQALRVEEGVKLGDHVVFAGKDITIRAQARLDAGCVIADGVTIGQNAWIRCGSVVLTSVPANAIVQGNPAQVVGYVEKSESAKRPDTQLIDLTRYENTARPARIPVGVANAAIHLMRDVTDERGSLVAGEFPEGIPFRPVRYFSVFNVPSVELRGEHAHKLCQQFLVCQHGKCRILLDDGTARCEVLLERPDVGIFMPEMIWGTQYRYTHDAILMVLASRPYEPDDYIRSYDEFLLLKQSIEKSGLLTQHGNEGIEG